MIKTKNSNLNKNQNSDQDSDSADSEETDKQSSEERIHTYEVITADMTWDEAYNDCIKRGGYLHESIPEKSGMLLLHRFRHPTQRHAIFMYQEPETMVEALIIGRMKMVNYMENH